MRIRYILMLFVSACVLAAPAYVVSKKDLEAQNMQLMQRLTALENRMLTGDPAAERLMQRMDSLETSQRALTGEVERLRFERDTLQEEVRALAGQIAGLQTISEDMRRHLEAVDLVAKTAPVPSPTDTITYGGGRAGGGVYSGGSSIAGPPSIVGVPTINGAQPAGNDITKLAEIGQDKMSEGDFAGAQMAFRQYLDLNTEASDRGDVYFWLGETYYVKGGFTDAADAYIASMRAAPKGDYAPDAMIRLASTARALGKNDMACQTLNSFPTQYPKATPAVREKARLERARSGC